MSRYISDKEQQLRDADYWRSAPPITDHDDEDFDGDWDDLPETDEYRSMRKLYRG